MGQDHVVQALGNAIRMNRVTHAYLFSGTRGVGKTSIARIFAKCLNCIHGPTETPCNTCDICQAISVGQDVDVIEIDGASNNGVEQVRELRQNASLRPSRARTKIYYIDEVHMLSTGAFNALLKTLEEPPEHVKFFFATTEPGKIPVTVLSRCQRYDFAGIRPDQISDTLGSICDREGVKADPEALLTVARRSSGSMRDAQSLLEQLLSSGNTHLTEQVVHDALGLAPDESILDLIEALADHKPGAAFKIIEQALSCGVQAVDLLSGLLDFLRDVMVLAAGAGVELLGSAPAVRLRLASIAERWPLDTILVTLQLLSEARLRMRGNSQPRLLLELAVCRAARLEDFTDLSELLARIDHPNAAGAGSARPGSASVKKKQLTRPEPEDQSLATATARSEPAPARSTARPHETSDLPGAAAGKAESVANQSESLSQVWAEMALEVGGSLGNHLQRFDSFQLAGPDQLQFQVQVPLIYNFSADACETPENRGKIESVLRSALARPINLEFVRQSAAHTIPPRRESPTANKSLKHPDLEADNLVQDLVKLFEARPVHVDLVDEADLG